MTDSLTTFLRLEGPLQSWGDTSKFVIRRSMEAPTKSGLLGMICCAMGVSRQAAREMLPKLNTLTMGVRIDRPGMRWWDYHTVGAGIGMTTAAGQVKTGAKGTLITRREYLADAGFLVALQGDAALITQVADALRSPKWTLYLGRKSCPPSLPVFAQPRKDSGETWTNPMEINGDVRTALEQVPWCPRYRNDPAPHELECLIEWRAAGDGDIAPADAEVWYDAPFSFDPPVHHPRLVMRDQLTVNAGLALQQRTPAPPRPRAKYNNSEYKKRREQRLESDHGLCVFCKNPATTVQHVTYRRAGGNEAQEDLRSLCRLCHDAVTMIEYGLGMGLDRIDPCEPWWRDDILRTRGEIVRFRSEEGRRRALRGAPERVRRELLEENEE
ncbi:MAG: type I-E CRISPR-associated protein Cas5/CasD [Planctomycetaceae bacterium]